MIEARLPTAGWRDNPGLNKIIVALFDGDEKPRIVGGAVRDSLLGLVVSDIDLATKLHPETVLNRLSSVDIKAIPTGLDHGTITAVVDTQNFEITTLRRDVATDGRRATIAFATDWKEDAARRDFTFNALYADNESGEIFDYFGGLDDLDKRLVRFIGDPDARIAEDHLRILRYFRFLARFGGERVDQPALTACASASKSLMALSRERIASELLKILGLPDPSFAVSLMIERGIFANFLPEISDRAATQLRQLISREIQYSQPISLSARLLSILPTQADIVDKIVMRLKLSNRMRVDLATRLADSNPEPDNIRSIAYKSGKETARDVALLYAPDVKLKLCLEMLIDWEAPQFPLKGGALIKLGLRAGPVVAKTLQQIEAQWIKEGFPPENRLSEIIDQFVAGALLSNKNA